MRKIGLIIISGIILAGCIPKQTSNVNLYQNDTGRATKAPTPTVSLETIPTSSAAAQPKMQTQAKKATLKTSMGDIVVELYADKAPVTVANFAALSEGTIEWTDPRDGSKQTNVPYYKNIIFHRVIKDFMIQGGDITGTGRGGPGYQFKDELDAGLDFSAPGILAMANSGPATNGSQFFITTIPTPWLNGKHTIFGKVISGMEVVTKIENTPTGAGDKPTTDVVLKEVIIER